MASFVRTTVSRATHRGPARRGVHRQRGEQPSAAVKVLETFPQRAVDELHTHRQSRLVTPDCFEQAKCSVRGPVPQREPGLVCHSPVTAVSL